MIINYSVPIVISGPLLLNKIIVIFDRFIWAVTIEKLLIRINCHNGNVITEGKVREHFQNNICLFFIEFQTNWTVVAFNSTWNTDTISKKIQQYIVLDQEGNDNDKKSVCLMFQHFEKTNFRTAPVLSRRNRQVFFIHISQLD